MSDDSILKARAGSAYNPNGWSGTGNMFVGLATSQEKASIASKSADNIETLVRDPAGKIREDQLKNQLLQQKTSAPSRTLMTGGGGLLDTESTASRLLLGT